MAAMAVRKPLLWRLVAATAATGLLFGILTTCRFDLQRGAIEKFVRGELVDYLRTAFPEDMFGDHWGRAVHVRAVREQMERFNAAHWESASSTLRIRVISVDRVTLASSETDQGRLISVSLPVGETAVAVALVVNPVLDLRPAAGWTAVYAVITFAFALWFPLSSPINAYPLARGMSLIFDRKVSSGQTWGMYRLSHLGGGGRLEGFGDNGFRRCNNPAARMTCFEDVHKTYTAVRQSLFNELGYDDLRQLFQESLEEGFQGAERRLRDESPTVYDDDEVIEVFRPFVRKSLFNFSIINLEDTESLAAWTSLAPSSITVDPLPSWLLAGGEVYYPKAFIERLISEIQSGLRSAYGRAIDRIRIHADEDRPFVFVDLTSTGLAITPDNAGRVRQYLAKPYQGQLDRIRRLMEGFGEIILLDGKYCFNLTERMECGERAGQNLTWRLGFRRVSGHELEYVRECFRKKMR